MVEPPVSFWRNIAPRKGAPELGLPSIRPAPFQGAFFLPLIRWLTPPANFRGPFRAGGSKLMRLYRKNRLCRVKAHRRAHPQSCRRARAGSMRAARAAG